MNTKLQIGEKKDGMTWHAYVFEFHIYNECTTHTHRMKKKFKIFYFNEFKNSKLQTNSNTRLSYVIPKRRKHRRKKNISFFLSLFSFN